MRQRSLLFCLILLIGSLSINAQSIAPNWTATDINGFSHTLTDYTNAGKHVIIDFSATWCGPCWSYHQSGTLETMWDLYGPDGTDELMIFYIESDYDTNLACITGNVAGCSDATWGDWTAGVNYPIINLTPSNGGNVWSQYGVPGFPTVSVINADTDQYWNLVGNGASGQSILESWVFGSFALEVEGTAVDAVCGGDGQVISDAMNGAGTLFYNWSNGAFTPDIVDVDPGQYTLTVTDGNGFSADAAFTVGGNPNGPVGVAMASVQDVDCNGDFSGSISIQAEGGNGSYDYSWSNGSTGADLFSVPSGDYQVSITDGIGCESVETFTIQQPEQIILNYSTINASCGNQNGSVNASAVGGTGLFSYTLAGETNNTGQFTFLMPGIYELYSVDQNFCETTTNVEIFEIEAPMAVAGPLAGSTLSCENATLSISGLGSTTGATITYDWTTNDGNIVSGASDVTATVDAAGTYTLTVFDLETGCEETAEVVVSGNTLTPLVAIASPDPITCTVSQVGLVATSTMMGPYISYNWTTDDGNILSGQNSLTPTVDAGGTYMLTAANLQNGCASSESVTVTADADIPTVSVSDATLTCDASTITICAEVSAGATAAWTINGNIVNSNCVDVNAAGNYNVEVSAANGCTATAQAVVSDMTAEPAIAVATPEMLTCSISSVVLAGTVEGNPSDYTFQWINQNDDVISTELITDVSSAGSYTLVVTNEITGCSSEEVTMVDQSDDLPVLVLSPADDLTCLITTITVSASVEGNVDDYSFSWTNQEGLVVGTSAETEVTEPGIYSIAVVNNTTGCATSSSLTVHEIREDPVSSYELMNTNGVLSLGSTSSGSPMAMSWTVNGEEIDAATIGNLSFSENGIYTICLAVTNDCSTDTHCEDYNYAVALVSEDQTSNVQCHAANDGMIEVIPNGGEGNYTISWEGPNDFTSDQLSISGLAPGEYSMMLDDSYGYSLTASYMIDEPTALELGSVVVDSETAAGAADGSVSISIFGGTGDYTYLWSSGSTDSELTNVPAGEYTLDVTDENGCSTTFGPFEVQLSTAVEDLSFASSLAVYPVPASDRLYLEMDLTRNTSVKINVTDAYGRLVSSLSLGVRSVINETLDVSNLDSGIYFLQITDGKEHTTEKFMVIK